VSTESQRFLDLHLEQVMFRFVGDIHLGDVGSLYRQKQQRDALCAILKMNVNQGPTVLGLAYFVIKVLRGSCRA
jgi:hypothetical protein